MFDASETLKSAKDLLAAGDFNAALNSLFTLKNEAEADYALGVKISKISDKALKNSPNLTPLKIAIVSSTTQTFFTSILRYFCAQAGFNAEVKAGDFGAWRSEIVDEKSWLYEFKPDVAIISINWRDAAAPAFAQDPSAEAERIATEFESFWSFFKSHSSATLFQHAFDIPNADAAGYLSRCDARSRVQVLKRANTLLLERAQKFGVSILDITEVRARVGSASWEDPRMWFSARQHPAFNALPSLAAEYARAVRAAKVPTKKVCVLDLDNTLWGGVIGEDGIGGIKLGAPDPVGEAYTAFQRYLLELKGRGILLAVCSKNNEADALLPFENHPDMLLKRSDFAAFKANWNPKSQNISEIAQELNLGAESFVFVDDNPAEIAQVNAVLPEVSTLLLPPDPSDFVNALDALQLFDALGLSADDLMRNATYLENAKRASAMAGAANPKDFLKNLEMSSAPCEISELNLARAAQLAGKTNQFNLTTRRHGAEKISEIASRENAFAKTFNLKDNFGDMGVVGFLLASPADASTLEIDTLLLSCRALGRTLEHFIIADLLEFAKARDFEFIRGIYIPSEKNSQTKDLFEKFGFKKESENADTSVSWILEVKRAEIPAHFIKKS